LGGYNLCYIRPGANLAAITGDEYKAPVVASWNAGNGRVLCYLGEADGKYSGAFAKWNQTGEFYATLARWAEGKHQPLPDEMLLTQEIRDGVCLVQLHLDPARKAEPFSTLPRVRVLHGLPGAAPAKDTVALAWKNADLMEAAIPMAGRETILNTVEIAGQQPVTLPAACLPYSPEFAPDQPGRGAATQAEIATTTGGREQLEIPKLWSELPVKSRYVELSPWLLVVAAILFLMEILERRTGWVSRRFGKKLVAAPVENEQSDAPDPAPARKPAMPWLTRKPSRTPVATSAPRRESVATISTAAPQPAADKPSSTESTIDAMRQARERAKNRMDKDR
jgi:hypothetical protein